MDKDQAIKIIARHAVYMAARDDGTGVEWGCYPEIGENDWLEILEEVDRIAPLPNLFEEAYELLEKRANSTSAGNDFDGKVL